MKRLQNKTAVITGATTGLGFETAKQFLAEGARIIITGQNTERLTAAASELGENAIPGRADVRSLAEIDSIATLVTKEFGGLDILFVANGTWHCSPNPVKVAQKILI